MSFENSIKDGHIRRKNSSLSLRIKGDYMKKHLYILIVLFIILSLSFSYPGPRIDIYLENFSQQNIIVEYKLFHGESDPKTNYFFEQEINKLNLNIEDMMFNDTLTIRPYKRVSLIVFHSLGEDINQLRAVPLMDFLKNTYEELTIYTEDKSKIITLDTIENEKITRSDYKLGTSYIIEIYDQACSEK